MTCSRCGTTLADAELIGIEIRGVYDGVVLWQCSRCGYRWHRWPPGDFRRVRVDRYLAVHEGGSCTD